MSRCEKEQDETCAKAAWKADAGWGVTWDGSKIRLGVSGLGEN